MHLPSWEFIDILNRVLRDERVPGAAAARGGRGTGKPDLLTLNVFGPCEQLRNPQTPLRGGCSSLARTLLSGHQASPRVFLLAPHGEDGGKLQKVRAALKIHLCTRMLCIFGRFIT